MKKLLLVFLFQALLVPPVTEARNDVDAYSIQDALSQAEISSKLGTNVKFYFGDGTPGGVAKKFGTYRTNKKTNAFNKSDLRACQWAFLSAMLSLKDRALKEGANAVINIKSNYKNNVVSSSDTFQCGAGNFVAGVALIGTVVTLH